MRAYLAVLIVSLVTICADNVHGDESHVGVRGNLKHGHLKETPTPTGIALATITPSPSTPPELNMPISSAFPPPSGPTSPNTSPTSKKPPKKNSETHVHAGLKRRTSPQIYPNVTASEGESHGCEPDPSARNVSTMVLHDGSYADDEGEHHLLEHSGCSQWYQQLGINDCNGLNSPSSCSKEILKNDTFGLVKVSRWSQWGDAKCLCGTMAGIYYQPARQGSNGWVFHFEGGGLCIDKLSCERKERDSLSSAHWQCQKKWPLSDSGILSRSPNNPFKDFNMILVPYCSQDLFLGKRENPYDDGGGRSRYYRGGHIVDMVFGVATKRLGMKNKRGTTIVLSGFSAGGVGVQQHINNIAKKFHRTKVRGFIQGGFTWPRQRDTVQYDDFFSGAVELADPHTWNPDKSYTSSAPLTFLNAVDGLTTQTLNAPCYDTYHPLASRLSQNCLLTGELLTPHSDLGVKRPFLVEGTSNLKVLFVFDLFETPFIRPFGLPEGITQARHCSKIPNLKTTSVPDSWATLEAYAQFWAYKTVNLFHKSVHGNDIGYMIFFCANHGRTNLSKNKMKVKGETWYMREVIKGFLDSNSYTSRLTNPGRQIDDRYEPWTLPLSGTDECFDSDINDQCVPWRCENYVGEGTSSLLSNASNILANDTD